MGLRGCSWLGVLRLRLRVPARLLLTPSAGLGEKEVVRSDTQKEETSREEADRGRVSWRFSKSKEKNEWVNENDDRLTTGRFAGGRKA